MVVEIKQVKASGLDYAVTGNAGSVPVVMALMHGMYEGQLVPLRVDEYGRIGSLAEA